MEDLPRASRRLGRRRRDPQALVVETVQRHAETLLRVARRHSASAADAEDAYQRALEIFVRHAHRIDPATADRWLSVVVKHEAIALRRQGARLVGVDDEAALDALHDGRHVASLEERSESFEELARAAEALARLKPHEMTALVLKAQGLSYKEIAERQNWTYTKVNRCISEGRRAFLQRFEGIATGAECKRWTPVLSAMVDDEATAEQLVEARPHLRNCSACRATLAGMRNSAQVMGGLLPGGVVLAALQWTTSPGHGLAQAAEQAVASLAERVMGPVVRLGHAVEATAGTKIVAVAASTAALAGGGVAAERQVDRRPAAQHARAAATARPAAEAPARAGASTVAPDPSGATAARVTMRRRARRPPPGRPVARARPAASTPVPAAAGPAGGEFALETAPAATPEQEARVPAPVPATATAASARRGSTPAGQSASAAPVPDGGEFGFDGP